MKGLTVLMIVVGLVSQGAGEAGRQITKDPANDYHVKWSADGRTLAFASQRSGESKIWLIPADGGEAALLETGLSGDHHISWAPDGQLITFDARWKERPSIFTISLADGETKRLSPEGAVDFQPAWSPDGSRIAFASLRSGEADIWLMPAGGGPATPLTADDASDLSLACWTCRADFFPWPPPLDIVRGPEYLRWRGQDGVSSRFRIRPTGLVLKRRLLSYFRAESRAGLRPDGR
jgi:dipeptidyl aminopeptidase/acylaminoacyl peptidase